MNQLNLPLFLNVFVVVIYFVNVDCQSISTIPDTDGGDAYVASNEGEVNVTVVCIVFSGSTQVQTPWRIRRDGEDQMLVEIEFDANGQPTSPAFIIGDVFASGEQIPIAQPTTYETNFTFLNFTNEFDTTQLQCGDMATETRNFFLGFPGLMHEF